MYSFKPNTRYKNGYAVDAYTPNQQYRKPQSRQYQAPLKKHSGCKEKRDYITKDGVKKVHVMYGWKYTKRDGLSTFVATPASDKHQKGKNPNYLSYVVTITSGMNKSIQWGQYNIQTGNLSMIDIKMNASAKNNFWSYKMPEKLKNQRR